MRAPQLRSKLLHSIYLPHLHVERHSYRTSPSFSALCVQRAFYEISVRQTSVLSTTFFRLHLTTPFILSALALRKEGDGTDILAFNDTLTTAGRIRDLHPLEFSHAGQTKKISNRSY